MAEALLECEVLTSEQMKVIIELERGEKVDCAMLRKITEHVSEPKYEKTTVKEKKSHYPTDQDDDEFSENIGIDLTRDEESKENASSDNHDLNHEPEQSDNPRDQSEEKSGSK